MLYNPFDIQMFGDNDTVTSSREGNLIVKFYDGDTRTVKLDNPKTNLTAANVKSFVQFMITNQPIIGDKTGASLTGAESFKIVEKTDRKLDLT